MSNDNGEGTVAEDDEYLFPNPDEAEGMKKPLIGMSFDTIDEAHKIVNVYGQLYRFAVYRGRNYKNKKYFLMCNRSKKAKEPKNIQKKRKRYIVKGTNCKMKVIVALQDGKCRFTDVDLVHNHDLVSSPALTKFFISHRYMSEEEKNFSRILQEARIKPRRIMQIFKKMKGSFRYVNFGKTNINNLKQADRRARLRNSDIDSTMVFVRKMQKRNQVSMTQ
jgi:hypothetical protein